MPHNQPWAVLTKMSLRDGIAVLWCNLPSDAARHIAYIMKSHDVDGFNSTLKVAEQHTTGYAGFIKHTKKRKNIGDKQFAVMLSTIEGVSAKRRKPSRLRIRHRKRLCTRLTRVPTTRSATGCWRTRR